MVATAQGDTAPDPDKWRTYDEFAAGIDTYRLPAADLSGEQLLVTLDDGSGLELRFLDAATVEWTARGLLEVPIGTRDPYDAVAVRDDVFFLNLPLTSRERESLTLVYSRRSGRVVAVQSTIQPDDQVTEDVPQVAQAFRAGMLRGVRVSGEQPAASRDLIGKRNVYRYSPAHLYEHVYLSSQRYAWQCLQGVQRGHGDVDLSTVWKFEEGLYLFCFREFKIAVASVWLHDLSYQLRTTGIFLGLDGSGAAEHARAGGHIYPLGVVAYPDVQPV